MKISAYIKENEVRLPEHRVFATEDVFTSNVREDKLSENFGSVSVNRLQINNLCICSYCSNTNINLNLDVTTHGDAIVLIFTDQGYACIKNCFCKQCEFPRNRFNLYYLIGTNHFTIHLQKGSRNKYLAVVLSKQFYTKLINSHPCLFAPLNSLVAQETSSALFNKSHFASYEISEVIRQIQHCAIKGEAVSLFMGAKVLELFAVLFGSNNKQQTGELQDCIKDKIYYAKKILEKNYKNPPTIHQLAISVGTNDTTLKKGFKELFNTTVYGYLFDYRMGKAKGMLSENKMSIQDISICIGYENQSNFATAFKRKYGIAPREFLKTAN